MKNIFFYLAYFIAWIGILIYLIYLHKKIEKIK